MNKRRVISLIIAISILSVFMPANRIIADEQTMINEKNFEKYTGRYIVKYTDKKLKKKDLKVHIDKVFDKLEKNKIQIIKTHLFENMNEKLNAEKEIELKRNSKVSQFMSADIVSDVNDTIQTIDNKYDVIQLEEAVNSEEFIEELENNMGEYIEYIQPDYVMSLSGEVSNENEDTIQNENNIVDNSENVVLRNTETDDTIVALLDTGVDVSHQDLKNHVIEGYDFYNNAEIFIHENSTEDVHGTHIAGVIANTAPEAKIMPLKVFENGKAYTSDIIHAIEYAENNNVSIVNCSWGSSDNNQALKEVMEKSNMLFICAAGNQRTNIDNNPIYPGAFKLNNIINVTSINEDMGISHYSNYGINSVDIAAKGRNINSTSIKSEYAKMDGTSISAGYVTGAAARYAVDKDVTSEVIKNKILSSADSISCLNLYVKNGKCINIDNLMSDTVGCVKEIFPEDDFEKYNILQELSDEWELYNLSRVVDVAGDSLILKENGTVWEFEKNDDYTVSIRQVEGANNIKQICSNKWSNVFLTNDGYVYENGMLVAGLSDIVNISEGQAHYSALSNNGRVYCWGKNDNGEAGDRAIMDNYDEMPRYQNVEYPIEILSGIKEISAGFDNNIALTSDNKLYSWGSGTNQVYENQYNPSLIEQEYSGIVTEIQATAPGTVAYVQDNYLYVHGNIWSGYEYSPGGLQSSSGIHFFHGAFFKDENNNLYKASNLTECPQGVNDVKMISGTMDDSGLILTNIGEVYSWDNDWFIGIAIPTPLIVHEENTSATIVIEEEQYNNSNNIAYKANQEKLEQMGWKEGYYFGKGDFTAESGRLNIRKTSSQIDSSSELIYDVTKIFTQRKNNWKGDSRVSVWTNHFKGNYSIELKGGFSPKSGQAYYDILGFTNTGNKANVGRYRIDPGTNGAFSVYNDRLNGANTREYILWKNAAINRQIKTNVDSSTATFQTFLDGSEIAASTIVSGAFPKDTFNMTDWNKRNPTEYITGIKISAQDREAVGTTIASIDSVKLVEHSKIKDTVVENAINSLSMSDLTSNPEKVIYDLNTLPNRMCGADITWSSSRPDLISNDGIIVYTPAFSTDITMTAKITNPNDKFTKYMDFNIVLSSKSSVEDNFDGTYSGIPSSNNQEGTSKFEQLPMWTFSYPGVNNGNNGECHSGQILVKDGYLVFKKISDRQTDNYKECVVGERVLSDYKINPLIKSANIAFTAKVFDTGTMRFQPLTITGEPVCTLILDASTKHIEIVDNQENQRIDNIDPTIDHDYEIRISDDNSFVLCVDGKVIKTNSNKDKREILSDAQKNNTLLRLKVWITNITYANREVGLLKRLSVSHDEHMIGNYVDIYKNTVKKDQKFAFTIGGPNENKTIDMVFDPSVIKIDTSQKNDNIIVKTNSNNRYTFTYKKQNDEIFDGTLHQIWFIPKENGNTDILVSAD